MAQIFVKKPVKVEAMQFLGYDTAEKISQWANTNETFNVHKVYMPGGRMMDKAILSHLMIETLEGAMRADIGDWIIKGVKGEFYPCKPDIFKATYSDQIIAEPSQKKTTKEYRAIFRYPEPWRGVGSYSIGFGPVRVTREEAEKELPWRSEENLAQRVGVQVREVSEWEDEE